MTTTRIHLLIDYPKFPAPLKQALTDRGIVLVEGTQSLDPGLLRRTLACVSDFGYSIKHPLHALLRKKYLSQYGVPMFSWNRDAPHNNNLPPWKLSLFSRLRPLDIYATHSLIDSRWRFADTVLFLPNAADISGYNLRGEPDEVLARLRDPSYYHWDVSFFGALDGTRHKEAFDRQVFFGKLAAQLDTLDIRHRFVDTMHTTMSLEEQVELIQTSRINLNYGARCDYGGFCPSGLPDRCFGIPACGGFLLTDKRIHLADSFEIGRHLDEFADLNECVQKIRHHLDNFGRSRDIAELGWRHVMHHHTYVSRAETIHNALLNWHSREIT